MTEQNHANEASFSLPGSEFMDWLANDTTLHDKIYVPMSDGMTLNQILRNNCADPVIFEAIFTKMNQFRALETFFAGDANPLCSPPP